MRTLFGTGVAKRRTFGRSEVDPNFVKDPERREKRGIISLLKCLHKEYIG